MEYVHGKSCPSIYTNDRMEASLNSAIPKKVHKKKAAKLQILKALTESDTNKYCVPKKLIIFDLNRVLILRPNKFSRKFILRPHAKQFLQHIATR